MPIQGELPGTPVNRSSKSTSAERHGNSAGFGGERCARDRWLTLAFVTGLVLYGLVFYQVRLPSLSQAGARDWPRSRFFSYLLVPEVLVEGWFDAGQATMLDRAPILGLAAGILLLATCAGRLSLRALRVWAAFDRLERFVFASAVGLNLVSLWTLVVGLGGGLRYRSAFLASAVLVVGAETCLSCRQWLAARGTPVEPTGPALWRSGFAWAAAPFAMFILLAAMLPPIEFDVREYHLQAPKEFFLAGRITFLPHNVYANMPLGSEMHSLLGMSLLGDWRQGALVGKTVQAFYTLLAALALLAAGRRWFSPRTGGLAALVYLSTPWIVHVSTMGLIEGAVALYVLLSCYAFLMWQDRIGEASSGSGTGLVALCGLLSGSAIACKYPATLFVLVPIGAAVVVSARQKRALALGVYLFAAAVACGPWFAKNWALTGNPTYPLLYGLFGGETWNEAKNARWERAHRASDFGPGALGASAADVLLRSEWLSPLIWPLAATGFCAVRNRRKWWLAGYVGFVFAAWWLTTHRIDRFWLPVLPIAALLSAASTLWVFARDEEGWARLRRVSLLVYVALGLFYCGVVMASGVVGYNRLFVSLTKLWNDPERVGQWQRWLNEHTPPGKAVLAVGDAQVFDLEPPTIYNTAFDDVAFERRALDASGRLRSKADIQKALEGVAYVYVHWGEIGRYRSPGNYGFSDRVTPKLFGSLVSAGVLGRPIEFADGVVQVFPVTGEQ